MENSIVEIDRHYMKVKAEMPEPETDNLEGCIASSQAYDSAKQATMSLDDYRLRISDLEAVICERDERILELSAELSSTRENEQREREHSEAVSSDTSELRQENEHMREQIADLLQAYRVLSLKYDQKVEAADELSVVITGLEQEFCDEMKASRALETQLQALTKSELPPLDCNQKSEQAVETDKLAISIVDFLLDKLRACGYLSAEPFDEAMQKNVDCVAEMQDYELVHALRRMHLTSEQRGIVEAYVVE